MPLRSEPLPIDLNRLGAVLPVAGEHRLRHPSISRLATMTSTMRPWPCLVMACTWSAGCSRQSRRAGS